MTRSYDEVMQEIQALKNEAVQIRKSEISSAIAEARAIIDKFELTIEDLGFAKSGKKIKVVSAKVVKYRSDTNPADTYGGKGPFPGWLKQKIDSGRKKEEFEVK